MKIEFDPNNETDVSMVKKILGMSDTVEQSTAVDQRVEVPIQPDVTEVEVEGYGTTPFEYTINDPDVDTNAVPAPERDKSGRVWDERIDSGNHKVGKDGMWHKRRGVEDGYREQIIAELLSQGDLPSDIFATSNDTTVETSTPPPPTTLLPAPVIAPTPPPPVVTSAVAATSWPPPATTTAPTTVTWDDLFGRTMTAIQEELINKDQVDRKCEELGIVGLAELAGRPELYEQFLTELMI